VVDKWQNAAQNDRDEILLNSDKYSIKLNDCVQVMKIKTEPKICLKKQISSNCIMLGFKHDVP
jgi:hypothetical protein